MRFDRVVDFVAKCRRMASRNGCVDCGRVLPQGLFLLGSPSLSRMTRVGAGVPTLKKAMRERGWYCKTCMNRKKTMNVRDFEIRSYEDAVALLRGKTERRVCNNTFLRKYGSLIYVVLHGHDIVEWEPSGRVFLYSRRYRTVTTKDRMNQCIPREYRVFQEKNVWFVSRWSGVPRLDARRVPFVEGMNLMTAFEGVVPGSQDQG